MPLALPLFTFLCGSPGSGKTKLAELLCSIDSNLLMASFDEPIREATLSTFYPDQMHLGLDLRDPETKKQQIPATGIAIGDFMSKYQNFLRQFSPFLIGEIAKRRLSNFSFHTIFDDLTTPDDIAPFVLAWGADNCLIIYIERTPKSIAPFLRTFCNIFVRKIHIMNIEGYPEKMLDNLAHMLPSRNFPSNITESPDVAPKPEEL
jgi:hypothetical protein